MKVGCVFVLSYPDWQTNGKYMYTRDPQQNKRVIITVNLPHGNPISLSIVCHETFEIHIEDTILQHDSIEILTKNNLAWTFFKCISQHVMVRTLQYLLL